MFKELYRRYPVADVEDYHKAGKWNDEVMRIDLRLVEAHRKEGGAPEPMDLEDVPEPVLPKASQLVAITGGIRPIVAAATRPAGMTPLVAPGLRPAGTLPAGAVATQPGVVAAVAGAATAAAAPGALGPITELRLIAIFVAKWKLDATRTKAVLAKLTPARRRYVIQNFKTAASGPAANQALDIYLAQCEKTGSWGAATGVGSTPSSVAALRPVVTPRPGLVPVRPGLVTPARPLAIRPATPAVQVGGLKRPLAAVTAPVLDPSKRPRLAAPQAMIRPLSASSPARPVPPSGKPPSHVLNMRPVSVMPAMAKPVVAKPAVAKPAVPKPAVAKPGVATPVVPRPVAKLGVATPTVPKPAVPKPAVATFGVATPALAKPAAAKPQPALQPGLIPRVAGVSPTAPKFAPTAPKYGLVTPKLAAAKVRPGTLIKNLLSKY